MNPMTIICKSTLWIGLIALLISAPSNPLNGMEVTIGKGGTAANGIALAEVTFPEASASLSANDYNMLVAQDGSGDFTTIQQAIDASRAYSPEPVTISAVYLGRPWRDHARTVFLDSEMGSHISPEGWHNWGRPEAEETVFYAEYYSGNPPAGRVPWATLLRDEEAESFTLERIYDGWIPDEAQAGDGPSAIPSPYLEAVLTFADNVLARGRDRYGDLHSPLFVDGIDVTTGDPVTWHYDGDTWIISNFGSQQNLMRVLTSLSDLTGEAAYRETAEEATRYMFEHHSDKNGLLHWGGHQFVDLETMEHQFESRPHELKNHFPYYEFLWEVDPDATRRMLRAMWNAHIVDWEVLDMNRHGEYDIEMGRLWDHEFEQQEPFFEGLGLTFINFGTDMVQVALSLYFLDEDEGAREWGLRLYEQYVRARHPETGLGVYQYSQPLQREEPPGEGPLEGTLTYSQYGDRAANQFGDVYGDIALEGNVLWGNRVRTLYGRSPIMTLHLAEQMEGTQAGSELLQWTLDGMRSAAEYLYLPEENYFRPMWTDGTDLTDEVMPRTGYYGEKGDAFEKMIPGGIMALAYSRAARLAGDDPVIWNTIRHIMIGNGLGDPGENPGAEPDLNLETDASDPDLLVAALELQRATGHREFIRLAEKIGDNILEERFHDGFFRPSADHIYARFDDPEPLALLMLEAIRQNRPDAVPAYLPGVGGTQGEHDETGRTRDWEFYDETH